MKLLINRTIQMTTKSNPSNSIIMRINRDANIIELQWDRKSKNIKYVLKNLALFNIELTTKIKSQVRNFSNIGGKKINIDTIYI